MPRIAVNGISLAVNEWPGPGKALTQEEADAMAAAIVKSKLVSVPNTNHYTVLLGQHPSVKAALRAFLEG